MSEQQLLLRTGCPDAPVLLQALQEEPIEELSWVGEHVNSCPTCQQTAHALIGSLPGPMGPLPPELDVDDETPPDLPGYELLGRLGHGGMGVVWRVRDLRFHRNLAVKVMKARATHPEQVRRFIREGQLTGQLTHPGIVVVHERGRLMDGRHYYTMKLVEGRTLAAILAERTAPGQRQMEFIRIFLQVCQAIAFAHRRGVIHRDLKPGNIMVGEHGEVQVMDWGLAKALTDEAGPAGPEGERNGACRDEVEGEWTRNEDVLGTLAYMPPEQARGQIAEVDRRSDVFGLGAILCEILTGAPPYRSENRVELLWQAKRAELTDALQRLGSSGADPELTRLAIRCLATQKSDRPADAAEVALAVAGYLSGVEERLHQERLEREREQVQTEEERKRLHLKAIWERKKRRLTLALAGTVLVAVALTAIGGLYAEHQRSLLGRQRELVQAERQARLDEIERHIAAGAFDKAEALLQPDTNGPDERFDYLGKMLQFARDLDRIRLMRVTWTDAGCDCSSALPGYRDAFRTWGIDPTQEESFDRAVEMIGQAPIRKRVVAALDDWSYVSNRERARVPELAERYERQRDRLLRLAQAIDPDPVRNVVRESKFGKQPNELREFAFGLELGTTSPELLVLVGSLLPLEDGEKLWRKHLLYHAGDFWLNAELATLLMRRADDPANAQRAVELATDATRFYQAALTLRPDVMGVYLDLAGALMRKGDREAALVYCRHAERLGPRSAAEHGLLGTALLGVGDRTRAVEHLEAAVRLDLEDGKEDFPDYGRRLREATAPPEAPPARVRPFLTLRETYQAMAGYLKQQSKQDARFKRFITLTHLHNDPAVDDTALGLHRTAVGGLLNSLSWRREFVQPISVDEGGALLAFDLRDLGWHPGKQWQKLTAGHGKHPRYPYALTHEYSPPDPELKQWAGTVYNSSATAVPAVRADWFLAVASRPPLYHELLGPPGNATDLEKHVAPFPRLGPDEARPPNPIPKQIDELVLGYRKSKLTLEQAARELGIQDPQTLRSAIETNPALSAIPGLQDRAQANAIEREFWESFGPNLYSVVQTAAREMHRGVPLIP